MARLGRAQPFAPKLSRAARLSGDIIAAGAVSITGSATLTAIGSLASVGTISITGAADLDAIGNIAAAGSLSITGTATLNSPGDIASSGSISITGAADLDATGSLASAGTISVTGAADLDAIGSLAAAGSVTVTGTADLTGSTASDISSSGSLSITGATALNAIGQLLAGGTIFITGSAALSDGAPEPEATLSPAGRKRRKRRYFVEIDGQEFDVNSVEEAQMLLNKAKSLAEQVVTRELNAVIVKPGLKVPQIRTPNKELVPAVQAARAEIRDLYAELKRDLEIRYLIAKADEDEEEAIIRLLM